MDEEKLRDVYEMVDTIPLSRPKKNIGRDFSDAAMMAQVIHHYRPKLVALHNYPAANSFDKKVNNWNTLNAKVLKKIGLSLTKEEIRQIANCVPLAIEAYLYRVLLKFESPQEEMKIHQQVEKSSFGHYQENQEKMKGRNERSHSGVQMNSGRKGGRTNIQIGSQSDEVLGLIDEIEQSYAQLLKLQQISKLKDDVIKNLQKKVQKMIFS